jgi:hypothetical protein
MLAACGKPVPADKADFVGEWSSANMALAISADGKVHYSRVDGAKTTSLDAPLKGFGADGFDVGIGPMSTHFVVTQAPHQEGGRWLMTVDGVELSRPSTGAAPTALAN